MRVDKKNKTITLLNSFAKTTHVRYVSIDYRAFNYLRRKDDNLLIKYYLYLKYNYYLSNGKGIDNTAKQFLDACGYCSASGKYLSKVSEYTFNLSQDGIIDYKRYFDD